MTLSSLQFVFLNTTTIENLSRKTIVWSLAIYMPRVADVEPTFRTISYSSSGIVRTFAILHTKPGDNPFDLGLYQNFRSVMGDHWYDWFLPFRYSPCTNHDRLDGQFAMGPVVQRMRRDAGIDMPEESEEKPHRRRRRRRRRRRHRSDTGVGEGDETLQNQVTTQKDAPDLGQSMDEIDLESGLAHTNGIVH